MEDLKSTVALMESDDYQERLIAEYWQTKIRYERLKKYNNTIEAHKGTEAEPPHTCSLELLRAQEKAMARYLGILEKRVAIEQIPI